MNKIRDAEWHLRNVIHNMSTAHLGMDGNHKYSIDIKNGHKAITDAKAFLDDVDTKKTQPEKTKDFYLTKRKRKLLGKRLETFKRFWEDFAYKDGKADAADAWLDIPELTNQLVDKICLAARIEARHRAEMVKKGLTPKMAQGWIGSRRWEDDRFSQQEDGQKYPVYKEPAPVEKYEPTKEEFAELRKKVKGIGQCK